MVAVPPFDKLRVNGRVLDTSSQAGVGDDRFGGEEVAEGGEVGEAEYLGDAVVEE